MSISQWTMACAVFANARTITVQPHRISGFAPVDELVKETGRLFHVLHGEEGDLFRSVRLKCWILRNTVVLSLLPFDNPELKLKEQIGALEQECRHIPSVAQNIFNMARIVNFLIATPANPKGRAIFSLLQDSPESGRGVGLVSALARGRVPGWGDALSEEIQRTARHCNVIDCARDLANNIYSQIILPSSGQQSPVFNDLFHSFRTARLDVVFYGCEGFTPPQDRNLPQVTRRLAQSRRERGEAFARDAEIERADDWVAESFWKVLRAASRSDMEQGPGQEEDRRFLVRARIVLLANSSKVLLREDSQVIEVSDLVEGKVSLEQFEKRFPRRNVDQLRAGDLIVLRTSGSEMYLLDVADAIMRHEGRTGLRSAALDWKPVLERALKERGSRAIARRLEEMGHTIRDHRYIWIWTTNLIIRPATQKMFQDVITVLYSLGYRLSPEDDPADSARRRWEMMREIIRFHIMAGHRIRESLLERLKSMITAGTRMGDCLRFSLPAEGAGEMAVLRVADVDREVTTVPYTQIGVITELAEMSLWRG